MYEQQQYNSLGTQPVFRAAMDVMMDDSPDAAPVGVGAPLLSLSQSPDISGDVQAALPGFEWVLRGLKETDGEPGSEEGENDDGDADAPAPSRDPLSFPCFLCEMSMAAPGNRYKATMDGMVDEGATRIDTRALFEEVAAYARESVFRRAMADQTWRDKKFRCAASLIFVHYNMHDVDMRRGAAQDIRDIRGLKWAMRSTVVDKSHTGDIKRPSIDAIRTFDLLMKAEAAAYARLNGTTK